MNKDGNRIIVNNLNQCIKLEFLSSIITTRKQIMYIFLKQSKRYIFYELTFTAYSFVFEYFDFDLIILFILYQSKPIQYKYNSS